MLFSREGLQARETRPSELRLDARHPPQPT
jgi:hypothetical protein